MARWKVAVAGLAAVALAGCGGSSNFNQIWGSDEGSDTLLAEAKAAYDRGDFDKSEELATKLLDRNPDNENAAIVLGYTFLSQGGLDPYRVASCLVELSAKTDSASSSSSSSSKCNTTSADTGTTATLDEIDAKVDELLTMQQKGGTGTTGGTTGGASGSSGDTTDTLKKLQTGLLNMTDADFALLQEKEFTGSGSGLFSASRKLIIPKKVTEDLRANAGVDVLQKMNDAVNVICRFVDTETRFDASRYASCALTDVPRRNAAKAHYLWAISHLTESLVYQAVLLYSQVKGGTSNFQAAAEDINNFKGDLPTFVKNVDDMASAVNQVFDTSDPTSMISATLNDLAEVSLGFDAIAGLPQDMKDKVNSIMENIQKISSSLGSSSKYDPKALKTDLTEKLAKKVGEGVTKVTTTKFPNLPSGTTIDKITPESTGGQVTEKDIQDVKDTCTSYDNMTKDLPADKKAASKPGICP